MNDASIMREIIGYAALVAAIVDFVAVFVWFQREDRKKVAQYLIAGIVLLLIFFVAIFGPTDNEDGAKPPPEAPPAAEAESDS